MVIRGAGCRGVVGACCGYSGIAWWVRVYRYSGCRRVGIRDVAMVIRGAGCRGVVGACCGYSGIGGSVKWVRRSMVN